MTPNNLPAEYATIRAALWSAANENPFQQGFEYFHRALAALDALAARERPATPPAPPAAECAARD